MWVSERGGEQASGQVGEWASRASKRSSGASGAERAGKWGEQVGRASEWGEGGERGERGKRQQFLFSVHHHPNFYDFFLRVIAPFTGINRCHIKDST